MGSPPLTVLRPGDWVHFDGGEHQVVAVVGTSVRLRAPEGTESVVLASYLMASPGFMVVGGAPVPRVEPFGLLDGLPEEVLAEAREWERHLVEVETGLPPDAGPGVMPRPEYDPAVCSLLQRERAKAAELGVSLRTVEYRRARYVAQGLWGLVDQRATRAWEITGRADARLIAVARQIIDAETHASPGTRGRLIRRVVKAVEDTYGPDVVPLPGKTTFYKLIEALSTGRHTFASAVTRRQTANRPEGVFSPAFAARPGEQVQIDSTPIDVMVLLDTGMPVRAGLTIAVDVATRTICGAVLRPVGTKAVDAALLLARMLVPEPMRAGLVDGVADVGVPVAARPVAGRGRTDGAGGGEAGDCPGHDRHRWWEGVRVRYVHPGLRPAGCLGTELPAGNPDRQGHRRGNIRRDQHAVLPACRRVHRVEHHASRQRRGRGMDLAGFAGPAR
jgi:putative transposase